MVWVSDANPDCCLLDFGGEDSRLEIHYRDEFEIEKAGKPPTLEEEDDQIPREELILWFHELIKNNINYLDEAIKNKENMCNVVPPMVLDYSWGIRHLLKTKYPRRNLPVEDVTLSREIGMLGCRSTQYGEIPCIIIQFSKELFNIPNIAIIINDIILHECVHVVLAVEYNGKKYTQHGPNFRNAAKDLNMALGTKISLNGRDTCLPGVNKKHYRYR